jgi:V/A-type H+-transporting ATPase subunit F
MEIFVISDNIDTNIGLRLGGVGGVVVHERNEILSAISEAKEKENLGILVITRKLAQKVPEVIDKLKLSEGLPLVVEIPDRHLREDEEIDHITKYVRESIGIKV